jgi:hypothetical protein
MLNASLDTSFWNIAAQVGVVPYLFTFFRIHYCRAVEDEIVTMDPDETPLIYPQAMLFRVMREDGRVHHAELERPLAQFGAGEAGAIALAPPLHPPHWGGKRGGRLSASTIGSITGLALCKCARLLRALVC